MTSLFARNERLLWRTRFSTTEMPSQFLTQYNTMKSWQFSLFSLKLSLQSTHVHVVHWNGGRAVCRLREVSRLHGTDIRTYMYIPVSLPELNFSGPDLLLEFLKLPVHLPMLCSLISLPVHFLMLPCMWQAQLVSSYLRGRSRQHHFVLLQHGRSCAVVCFGSHPYTVHWQTTSKSIPGVYCPKWINGAVSDLWYRETPASPLTRYVQVYVDIDCIGSGIEVEWWQNLQALVGLCSRV